MSSLEVAFRDLDGVVGGFDETTGEFIDYSVTKEDFKQGWNHCMLMIQAYGTRQ